MPKFDHINAMWGVVVLVGFFVAGGLLGGVLLGIFWLLGNLSVLLLPIVLVCAAYICFGLVSEDEDKAAE